VPCPDRSLLPIEPFDHGTEQIAAVVDEDLAEQMGRAGVRVLAGLWISFVLAVPLAPRHLFPESGPVGVVSSLDGDLDPDRALRSGRPGGQLDHHCLGVVVGRPEGIRPLDLDRGGLRNDREP